MTFHSIPNVDEAENKFYLGEGDISIVNYLQEVLSIRVVFISLYTKNLFSEIKCNRPINFIPENSIDRLLRVTPRILAANVTHTSDLPVTIFKVNSLRIECNDTTGAY